jgi:hypothetical protein
MDGRFKHKLDTSTLHGTRYSVVYFELSLKANATLSLVLTCTDKGKRAGKEG